MSDSIRARLDRLTDRFQRIADKDPWIRACFTVKEGKFGLFGFGHPLGDGQNEAVLEAGPKENLPTTTELHALTDQAGQAVERMLRAGFLSRGLVGNSRIHFSLQRPWETWLMFLLHCPVTLMSCRVLGTDGKDHWALGLIDDDPAKALTVWIDNYPQVCVSGLTWLGAKCEEAGVQAALERDAQAAPTPKKPADEPPPDGTIEGNRIWLDGRQYRLTPGLRGLLNYLLLNPGAEEGAVIRHCGFSNSAHLHKRLKDLRDRLRTELKNAKRRLHIKTEDTQIYCEWRDK